MRPKDIISMSNKKELEAEIDLILLDLLQKEEIEAEINNRWITGKEALNLPYKKLASKNATYRTTERGRERLKKMGVMRC